MNTFPIDPIDIHRLLRRGTESVIPLLDKLYEKALQSHAFISDTSISKFDMTFRLQNAQRLLTYEEREREREREGGREGEREGELIYLAVVIRYFLLQNVLQYV